MDKEARISDMVDIAPDGGDRSWNLLFHRVFQDWETTRFYAFIAHISSKIPVGGDDTMVGQLNHSGVFDVRSFYKSLLKALSVFLPWQCIWSVKVPRRGSFFLWTAARGAIFTIDTLLRTCLLLIGVTYVGVRRKPWIIYYYIASLCIPCGVKSSTCLGFSG